MRGIERLHVVSHSIGARILLGSINSLSHDYKISKNSQFGSAQVEMLGHLGMIILKEPDVDILNAKRFLTSDMSAIHSVNKRTRVYIYVHGCDQALKVSQSLHYDIPRVGQLSGAKRLQKILLELNSLPEYLTIIDATSCESPRFLGMYLYNHFSANHSYWEHPDFRDSLKLAVNGDKRCEGKLKVLPKNIC